MRPYYITYSSDYVTSKLATSAWFYIISKGIFREQLEHHIIFLWHPSIDIHLKSYVHILVGCDFTFARYAG